MAADTVAVGAEPLSVLTAVRLLADEVGLAAALVSNTSGCGLRRARPARCEVGVCRACSPSSGCAASLTIGDNGSTDVASESACSTAPLAMLKESLVWGLLLPQTAPSNSSLQHHKRHIKSC